MLNQPLGETVRKHGKVDGRIKMKAHAKYLCLVVALCLVFGLASTAYGSMPDVNSHWAQASIEKWVESGLITGYPDGTFKPDNSITRAEFSVLANKACEYTAGGPVTFSDVNTTDWYYEEVARAVAAGYISGYPDGTFKPNGEITRQEVAVVIARILELDTSDTSALAGFTDAEAIPEWSQGFINAVVAMGCMQGYPDLTFQATKSITRAEAVVTLDNAIAIKTVATYTYDEAGTYGPETDTATAEGNVTITVPGVTLQNTLITGDLLLEEGIGDGDVTLKNITVKGNTTIKGGGTDSVYLEDCTLPSVTISREGVRVVASGSTSVNIVTLESGATLVEVTLTGEGFETVVVSQVVPAEAGITLEGNFTAVEVNAKDAKIEIPSESQVETLTLNAATKVTGEGKIGTADINAKGVVIEQKPATTNVAKGITANVAGRVVGSVSSPSSGGGRDREVMAPIEYASTEEGEFNIMVDLGTNKEDAIAKLASKATVIGSAGETGEATIKWAIEDYNGGKAREYTAVGVLTLPEGWKGVPTDITAIVTVKADTLIKEKLNLALTDFAAVINGQAPKSKPPYKLWVVHNPDSLEVTFVFSEEAQKMGPFGGLQATGLKTAFYGLAAVPEIQGASVDGKKIGFKDENGNVRTDGDFEWDLYLFGACLIGDVPSKIEGIIGSRQTMKLDYSTEDGMGFPMEITFHFVAAGEQEAPINLQGVAPTSQGNKDGKITGVDDTMEWSIKGGDDWTAVKKNTVEITGLAAGTYEVRYMARGGYNVSSVAEVTVPRYGEPPVEAKD